MHAFLCLNIFWLLRKTNPVVIGQLFVIIPYGSVGCAKLKVVCVSVILPY